MDLLVSLDKKLARALEWFLVGLFFVFLVLVCVMVVQRYVFATGITGGNEFVTIAFVFCSAIGGAVAISKREHIAITFFIDLLPRGLKMAIYISGLVVIAIVNAALIYYAVGWIQTAGHFPYQPLGWPQGYVHAAIPIGSALAILFCTVKIILTLAGRESIDVLWMPED